MYSNLLQLSYCFCLLYVAWFSLNHVIISPWICYTSHHTGWIITKLWIGTTHIAKSICTIPTISHIRNVSRIRCRPSVRSEITASRTVVSVLVIGMVGRICRGGFGGTWAVRHGRRLRKIGERCVWVYKWRSIRYARRFCSNWWSYRCTRRIARFFYTWKYKKKVKRVNKR